MGRKSKNKKKLQHSDKTNNKKSVNSAKNVKNSSTDLSKKNKKQTGKSNKSAKPREKTNKINEKSNGKKEFISEGKKRIFGGILSLIMIGLLIWIGALLFQRTFKPVPIAKILPASSTIATFELNTDYEHLQNLKAFRLIEKYPVFSRENLNGFLTSNFNVDESNIGRNAGVALLEIEEKTQIINPVYFLELKNSQKTVDELRGSCLIEIYKEQNIYIKDWDGINLFANNPDKKTYSFLYDKYLFSAPNKKTLTALIDSLKNNEPRLFDSEKYRRINQNMPLQKIAYLYINFEKAIENFENFLPLLANHKINIQHLKPFQSFLNSEGIALVAKDDKFALQSFISLNVQDRKEKNLLVSEKKFQAELMRFINRDVLAFWGGENLENKFKGIKTIIDSNILDELTLSLKEKYFGSEIDLNNDILIFFKNEFALLMEEADGQEFYTLILQSQSAGNHNSDLNKLHLLADAFSKQFAVYKPQTVEYILPDGTVSHEIIAVAENIEKKETQIEGAIAYVLEFGDENATVSYAVINGAIIISTDTQGIKNALNTMNNQLVSMVNAEAYNELILPILRNSDEISYFNFEKLFPILFENYKLPDFLNPLSSFSAGKNYFTDGISSINYLKVK